MSNRRIVLRSIDTNFSRRSAILDASSIHSSTHLLPHDAYLLFLAVTPTRCLSTRRPLFPNDLARIDPSVSITSE